MVCGVVIAGLEVIEACFGIIVIAAVTDGVTGDEAGFGGRAAVGAGNCYIAPCVVVVVADDGFGVGDCSRGCIFAGYDTEDALHVALRVRSIEVGIIRRATVGRVGNCKRSTQIIIDEVHDDGSSVVREGFTDDFAVERCVGVGYTVNDFLSTNTVKVIRVVISLSTRGDACKLSAIPILSLRGHGQPW